jgi:hypothetical protein
MRQGVLLRYVEVKWFAIFKPIVDLSGGIFDVVRTHFQPQLRPTPFIGQ